MAQKAGKQHLEKKEKEEGSVDWGVQGNTPQLPPKDLMLYFFITPVGLTSPLRNMKRKS
jgi:hypothetical protein